MLISSSSLINSPILSLQAGGMIARVSSPIIDPDSLKILGFKTTGPLVAKSSEDILDVKSIREYSKYGIVIDSIEELVASDDVVKISKVLDLNFEIMDLKVITKKGTKLGKVVGFTCSDDNFSIQQIIVQRPFLKSLLDPELVIPRKEVVEVTDRTIIVKNEEETIRKKAEKEDFIPNFVNPFRKNPEPDFAPADNETPDEQDN